MGWYKHAGVQERSPIAEPRRAPLGEGAAQAAPTAPHATPHAIKRRRNGPERFWSRGPVRLALVVCFAISSVVHCSMMPLRLRLPGSFEVKDMEGEALIPVDVLTAADLPPPPPPPPVEPTAPPEEEKQKEPAEPKPPPKVIRHADAGAEDASPDAIADAALDSSVSLEDAAIAEADAGFNGPRDPEGIVASPSVRADVVLVTLIVNASVIRAHPVGKRIGRLLRAIPQWDQFMSGSDLDPVRDLDWLLISGPSLRNSSRDSVVVHYSAPDAVIDRRIQIISRTYSRGGPFDAGVRSVKASLIYADGAERVVLRPQPHFLAVVPPNVAEKNARALSVGLSEPHHGEATFLRVVDPHHPMPEIPQSITEMRMRVTPRADFGADVFVECDTKDDSAAADAAVEIRGSFRRHNDALTSILTHGLLDHVAVASDGTTVTIRLTATLDQIETMVTLAEDLLGIQEAPQAPAGSTSATPSPRSTPSLTPLAPSSRPAPRRPR
jgi:hypothetical protein